MANAGATVWGCCVGDASGEPTVDDRSEPELCDMIWGRRVRTGCGQRAVRASPVGARGDGRAVTHIAGRQQVGNELDVVVKVERAPLLQRVHVAR
jgi:hypothetical protein